MNARWIKVLCFFFGLTVVVVTGLVLQLAVNRSSSPQVIERVIQTSNGPRTVNETVEPFADSTAEESTEVAAPMAESVDAPFAPPPTEDDASDDAANGSSDEEPVEDPFS